MPYFISRSRYDGIPHIYEGNIFGVYGKYQVIYDDIWNGLIIPVELMPNIPHSVGAEFELIARRFVIIDYDPLAQIVLCAIANTEGYRLLLHQIVFMTDLKIMTINALSGMSPRMQTECFEDYMSNKGYA